MDWTSIGGWVVAALTAAGGLYLNMRKAPAEVRKTDSEAKVAAATADETVGKAWAALYGEIRTRLAVVEQQNTEQAKEMSLMRTNSTERDRKISGLELRLAAWAVGIRRLTDQIISLEHIPVWKPDDDGHGS